MRHSFGRSAPAISLILLFAAHAAVAADDTADPSLLTLERIFEDEEFEVESFGPARWLEDGSGYTTLESSEEIEEAKEIVRYDPATGERSVLVPATSAGARRGRGTAPDRRLPVVRGRQAAADLHQHRKGVASQHPRRLLGARHRKREAADSSAAKPRNRR